MKIKQKFIEDILKEQYGEKYMDIYTESDLIQYIDSKTNAVNGKTTTRRNLGNIYAIYAWIDEYINADYVNNVEKYKLSSGFEYAILWKKCRSYYGGSKLQNHALNNRLKDELDRKFRQNQEKPEIWYNVRTKYFINSDYLYVNGEDISKTIHLIIKKYVELLIEKDNHFLKKLSELNKLDESDIETIKNELINFLEEESEARVFEIMSFAILKAKYKKEYIYMGYTPESIEKIFFELFKTGRTNANDGGIDFVLRPIGRFFQVTEVDNYDKYLLDLDKVNKFPMTFVVRAEKNNTVVKNEFIDYLNKKYGGQLYVINDYINAIEEFITIPDLKEYIKSLVWVEVNSILKNINLYYKLELNIEL